MFPANQDQESHPNTGFWMSNAWKTMFPFQFLKIPRESMELVLDFETGITGERVKSAQGKACWVHQQ